MNKLRNFITLSLVFLLPLFFLPLTQEYFITNKIYLFSIGILLLLVLVAVQIFLTKKIAWKRSPFDAGLAFMLIATVLSVSITSPNKIEAILNPYFGLLMLLVLVLFYFFLFHNTDKKSAHRYLNLLEGGGFIAALITIIFFFNPLKNASLPAQLQFLKFSTFSTVGNQLDLAILLGFLFVANIASLFTKRRGGSPWVLTSLFVLAIALFMSIYNIVRPENQQLSILLTPISQSWFASLEILKNPLTAIFGAGVGNFAAVFTKVKDAFFNQTPYWQISSFNTSRSAILHIFTETGLLGLITFFFLFYSLWLELKKLSAENADKKLLYFGSAYVFMVLLIFPPSFISLFLFFFILFWVASESHSHHESTKQELNLSNLPPVYLGIGLILIALTVGAGYLLGRSYLAEYYSKKSLDGYAANKVILVYNSQRDALIYNPYIERFHINFAQTNLIIANNIASRGSKLTNQERQTVVQAVQTAINEAKAVVILNPQKASNWEALAAVYRYILNAVKGADSWSVSSLQRAIQLDPANPVYRLSLGGVYYTLKDYTDAVSSFEQAVALKPDWANAHYNLAWSDYQLKNYQKAASEMQNVLKLIDKKQNPNDYLKAQKELEQFKKQIPKETGNQNTQPSNLQLPNTQQQPQISPKLELPKGASPEAQ